MKPVEINGYIRKHSYDSIKEIVGENKGFFSIGIYNKKEIRRHVKSVKWHKVKLIIEEVEE